MTGLERLGRPLPGKATGLAYPFSKGLALPFFDADIVFFDPCTRERKESRIRLMAGEVVAGTLDVLALAAEGLARQQSLAAYLMAHPGLPKVRPGLPEEGFGLWKEEENLMPRIYRGFSPPF